MRFYVFLYFFVHELSFCACPCAVNGGSKQDLSFNAVPLCRICVAIARTHSLTGRINLCGRPLGKNLLMSPCCLETLAWHRPPPPLLYNYQELWWVTHGEHRAFGARVLVLWEIESGYIWVFCTVSEVKKEEKVNRMKCFSYSQHISWEAPKNSKTCSVCLHIHSLISSCCTGWHFSSLQRTWPL